VWECEFFLNIEDIKNGNWASAPSVSIKLSKNRTNVKEGNP